MKSINELDKAALRVEFRKLYKDIGHLGCMQVVYEFLTSKNILLDIMSEESKLHGNER